MVDCGDGVLGILSGFLCGLYGIGALLGAYVSRVTDDSSSFKANICVVFFVENTVRMVFCMVCGAGRESMTGLQRNWCSFC